MWAQQARGATTSCEGPVLLHVMLSAEPLRPRGSRQLAFLICACQQQAAAAQQLPLQLAAAAM
jgi:hypothetical protein